jgi:hypothetical protein
VWDDLPRTTYSQLAAALAILTGAVPPDDEPALLDQIVARSLNPADDHTPGQMVLPSPLYTTSSPCAAAAVTLPSSPSFRLRWGAGRLQLPHYMENWNVDF